MRVRDMMSLLEGYGPDDEVSVTVGFPDLDDWEVTSWAVEARESEGMPGVMMRVYGTDFDYPDPERSLVREAKALLRRIGDEADRGW